MFLLAVSDDMKIRYKRIGNCLIWHKAVAELVKLGSLSGQIKKSKHMFQSWSIRRIGMPAEEEIEVQEKKHCYYYRCKNLELETLRECVFYLEAIGMGLNQQ